MRSAKTLIFAILFHGAVAAAPQTPALPGPGVITCKQMTSTQPETGVAYRGEVAIDDYKFVAHIPRGMTGWGGVAADAPFHGFTMFLGPASQSCILFEVHIRVDEDEKPLRPTLAKTFSLGKARAWQTSTSARVGAIKLTNVETRYSFRQRDQIDDGKILLVSPSAECGKTMPIYESFLQSIKFGK